MKATFALASTLVGLAAAQGVTDNISPTAPAPAGCTGTYDGEFEISVVQVSQAAKRDTMPIKKRAQCGGDGILVMTLKDGITLDAQKRTGYIASNFQFQFDGPAQAGAIYTSGFSVCGNGSLALGGSPVFYQCKSGSFYNLYDRHWAEQCEAVQIVALPCGGTEEPLSQFADGQIIGTTIAQTTIVTALPDGQPQVITTQVPIPVCQINDGQVQGHTTPCASVTIVPTPSTSRAPVSQFSDGQIQVTPAPPPPAGPPAPSATAPAPSGPAPSGPAPSAPAPAPSAPAPSAPGSTAAPSVSSVDSTLTTSAPGTSAVPSTSVPAPSATTTTVPVSGSSRVASSVGALVVGLMAAFICL